MTVLNLRFPSGSIFTAFLRFLSFLKVHSQLTFGEIFCQKENKTIGWIYSLFVRLSYFLACSSSNLDEEIKMKTAILIQESVFLEVDKLVELRCDDKGLRLLILPVYFTGSFVVFHIIISVDHLADYTYPIVRVDIQARQFRSLYTK